MTALALTLAVVAVIGVCVLSRWSSEMQDQLDRLLRWRG